MKILLVEDDEDSVIVFNDSVKIFQLRNDLIINTVVASDVNDALNKIDRDFDGAIIDIKLGNDDGGGNSVIDAIHGKHRIPIAVHTGTPSELEHRKPEYIGLYVRGECSYEDILNDLMSVYKTGLTKILGGKGIFEDALDKVFWEHLPHVISYWEKSELDSSVKEKQLLRYTLTHIQELLSLSDDGNDDKRNSAEVYIFPPIKDSVSEGFIVRSNDDNTLNVVLTPACDISQNRADFIQLALAKNLLEEKTILNKGTIDNRKNAIKNFVDNNKGGRFHFLPSFKDIPPSLIDFQNFQSVPREDFDKNYVCICSISSPFYKDVVSRFASYYARQGSPDFDVENLTDEIVESFQGIKPV